MAQKTVKLWIHQRCDKYSESDFVFSPKDFPSFKIGDVVDIHERDTQNNHLLLPVTQLHEDFNQKDVVVSVEKDVAATFKLTKYNQVIVTKIDPESVALDLVEVTFKEQYVSRSDMWRFRKHLLNVMQRVVYLNKKIEFCGIRCQVNEMFVRGERVACGVVSESTRVVFRSQSAMIFIFIQMSLEMWEFDYQGDLYFEKCVNGFLPDLFTLWKIKNCAHYVTIVVFSRWFYDAGCLDDFPLDQRSIVLKDYHGRYYQDFYRLIVQNEHYDDWGSVLFRLKCLLNEYKNSMAKYHEMCHMPPSRNSTAQEGNFLETINMCATVFARHNIDRDFERTGQQHVIITPGQGVFKVDRNLCNLTKQRVNDIAIGLDLVCLGEQPLHAVPLFIFPSKSNPNNIPDLREDFIIPHWMNFSFFSPIKYPAVQNSFVPRIPIPESVLERISQCKTPIMGPPLLKMSAVVDYDRYDDELFISRKTSTTRRHVPVTFEEFPEFSMKTRTPSTSSLESLTNNVSLISAKPSVPMRIPNRLEDAQAASLEADHIDDGVTVTTHRTIVGSADSSPKFQTPTRRRFDNQLEKARKPLVNPFKPGEFSVRITSIRRRWIHVFPVDAGGRAKSAHHFVSGMPVFNISPDSEDVAKGDLDYNFSAENLTNVSVTGQNNNTTTPDGGARSALNLNSPSNGNANTSTVGTDGSGKSLVWAWGVTGEEQWNSDMKIGTDWKSLTIPSLLPITIDFFPDHRSLRNDYVFSEHIILLEDETKELWGSNGGGYPLNIFNELVSQRLHQGMQLIVLPKELLHSATSALLGAGRDLSRFCQAEAYLCINRIFHRLTLYDNTIYITKFFPRHPYSLGSHTYHYQLQMPDSIFYKSCETKFVHDNLETYKWSVVDNYIAAQGNTDEYMLDRDMKFWESSFLLIPSGHPSIKKIIDKEIRQGDIFAEGFEYAETMSHLYLIDGFIKIMETANRIKRTSHVASNRIWRKSPPNVPQTASSKDLKAAGRTASTQSLTDELTVTMPGNILSSLKADKNFFIPQEKQRLPEFSFVSAELVHWLINNVAEINSVDMAILFCQQQMEEGRIAHVGSDQRFVYGFVLYYFVSAESKFSNNFGNFMEVEVTEFPRCSTEFGHSCVMRTENVDMDPAKKSDRHEWGQVRFGTACCPQSVLQLTIQWMVATGAVVGEMVNGWCRKAAACGFHLVAVPLDPFSTPSDQNSDPMRRPITIVLDEDIISAIPGDMFEPLATEILHNFGFLTTSCTTHGKDHQFVHLSGGMFVRIDPSRKGFQWVWNNMLGKRYRSSATGDEEFLDFMLADFRRFANNYDSRLATLVSSFKGFHLETVAVKFQLL